MLPSKVHKKAFQLLAKAYGGWTGHGRRAALVRILDNVWKVRYGARACVLLAGLWILTQLAFAQDNQGFRLSWACWFPEKKVLCLRPSGVLQWTLLPSSQPPQNIALGGRLQAQIQWEAVEVWADLGLWYEAAVQLGLLEAYAKVDLGELGLSIGKRRDYSGPWDETLMGRDGLWGLFARYRPAEQPRLAMDIAYLPSAGFAGGRAFLGAQADIFRAGAFVEIVRTQGQFGEALLSIALNPRLGLAGQEVEFFWQLDRGFWGQVYLPLALARFLPSSYGAETQVGLQVLDRARLELLLWWNPEWGYLAEDSPFPPEDRWRAWLLQPRKLLIGASYNWNDLLRLGVDISRAPVEAVRLYLRLYWRQGW